MNRHRGFLNSSQVALVKSPAFTTSVTISAPICAPREYPISLKSTDILSPSKTHVHLPASTHVLNPVTTQRASLSCRYCQQVHAGAPDNLSNNLPTSRQSLDILSRQAATIPRNPVLSRNPSTCPSPVSPVAVRHDGPGREPVSRVLLL